MCRFLIFLFILLAFLGVHWSNETDKRHDISAGLIEVSVHQSPCLYRWCFVYSEEHIVSGICLYPFEQMDQFVLSCGQEGRKVFMKYGLNKFPIKNSYVYIFFKDKELPVVYAFPKNMQKSGIYIKELDVVIAMREGVSISQNGEKMTSPEIYTN